MKFLKYLPKDKSYVDLAYMTGVLPVVEYSSGSELNMFLEYNFMNDQTFEEEFGLAEDEVRTLCGRYKNVSYEEPKWWYDGYLMVDGRCRDYRTEMGSMNEVADCIEHNIDEVKEDIIRMVSGIPVEADLSGKGYCDYLFVSKKKEKPAIILELKVDDSAEISLFGIGYKKKEKRHYCVIERHTIK